MYHPKDGHVSKNMYWEGNVYHLCVRLYIKAPFLPMKLILLSFHRIHKISCAVSPN